MQFERFHVRMKSSSLCSDEGPPCTCPLCASDWSSCVPHSEGLQLSRDLGATYLELPSLNHVFVGRYFGSVVSRHVTLESNGRSKNWNDYIWLFAGHICQLLCLKWKFIWSMMCWVTFVDPASPDTIVFLCSNQAVRKMFNRPHSSCLLNLSVQHLVEETGTGSYAGLLRKLFPKQRIDDVTSLFL